MAISRNKVGPTVAIKSLPVESSFITPPMLKIQTTERVKPEDPERISKLHKKISLKSSKSPAPVHLPKLNSHLQEANIKTLRRNQTNVSSPSRAYYNKTLNSKFL